MAFKQAIYLDVRKQMQPGDVIAYSGKAGVSNLIKMVLRAGVSHTSVVVQSKLVDNVRDPMAGFLNQVMEATAHGVQFARLSDHIKQYDGEIWWLPLHPSLRAQLDLQAFYNFLLHQEHKPYDYAQAVASGVDFADDRFGGLTKTGQDLARFFCSELVAAALVAARAVPHLNASEVTPIDVCRFKIFADDYYQIKKNEGEDAKPIKGWNTLDPTGWGE